MTSPNLPSSMLNPIYLVDFGSWVPSKASYSLSNNSGERLDTIKRRSKYSNYIYNPITRECIQLPQITYPTEQEVEVSTRFGFVDLTNEFKVVKVISWVDEVNFNVQSEVQVYTLGSTSWRKIESVLFYNMTIDMAELLNGLLHWRNKVDGETVITSFDLKYEIFGVVHTPWSVFQQNQFFLGVLRGCLSIADCSLEDRIEI
ncbi:hypothetical protein GIB67_004585 [Kingdonia uniflora]|uniref:F-box associated beta-propeller type 3 domain-containing protein n=1 Tax=Kingdonia uniflora TaxID=39325 RepID=A0A7J7MJB4_9MAGN|nr:hypothetical protein GIB67_004585 [Kingdonia uniflora]